MMGCKKGATGVRPGLVMTKKRLPRCRSPDARLAWQRVQGGRVARPHNLPPPCNGCVGAQVYAAMLEFARLAARLRGSSDALEDPEQRAIWRQRGDWLHEECAPLFFTDH